MVSFSCEACGDVIAKKKLDGHRAQCRGASFTCLDCMTHFQGTDYRTHTSCISEAQKYQGHLYREKGANKRIKSDNRTSMNMQEHSQAMVPQAAYVEDAVDGDDSGAVAIVDVPPRAPTPPLAPEPAGELPSNFNVFEFQVADDDPSFKNHRSLPAPGRRELRENASPLPNGDSQYSQFSNGEGTQFRQHGVSYGHAQLQPRLEQYESWNAAADSQLSQQVHPASSFETPAPKDSQRGRRDQPATEKSEKKRKRGNVEELDLSNSKRPMSRDGPASSTASKSGSGRVLHSGLTGGLSRLVTDQAFYDDRIDAGPTPVSPVKRSKHDRDEREAKNERRKSSNNSQVSSRVPLETGADARQHPRQITEQGHQNGEKRRISHRRNSVSSDDERGSSHTHGRKYIEHQHRAGSVQPTDKNQVIAYDTRAAHFLSLITKGPGSERGWSINKTLKHYHRERDVHHEDRELHDKELWKSLRLRRNSRGEIVLFA